jgi:hypothetical protein
MKQRSRQPLIRFACDFLTPCARFRICQIRNGQWEAKPLTKPFIVV